MPNITDFSLSGSNNFVFIFDRIKDIEYFSQTAMLPSVGLHKITQGLGTMEFKVPGTIMDLEDFEITFNVDENLKNYLAITSWMFETKKSKNFNDYMSDCRLIVLNNTKNPIVYIDFREVWPIHITSINWTVQDSINIQASATFTWHWYDITWVDDTTKPNVKTIETTMK